MDDRFKRIFDASGHPHASGVTMKAVHREMDWKEKAVEHDLSNLDDDAYASQVAQAIDRAAILSGTASSRSTPVRLEARATRQTTALAKTLGIKRSLAASGLADGLQLARFAVAMAEVLHMAQPHIPNLSIDRMNQKASGTLFQEVIAKVDRERPTVAEMDDAEVFAFCSEAFNRVSPKINREAKAAA